MSQQPCLPVSRRRKRDEDGSAQAITTFENIDSMDADEYLAAVVHQASGLPDVFVAEPPTGENKQEDSQSTYNRTNHIPIEGSAASLSYLFSKHTSILPPPSERHAPPNQAWVNQTLSNFSQLRSYLEKCHTQGVGGKATDRIAVPTMKDRPGWHVFCVGRDEARGNVNSYYGGSDEEESEEEENGVDNAAPSWKALVPSSGHEPCVRLVLQFDQVLVRRLLSHLAYYIQEGWSPTVQQRSVWIYSLLARLERPLHRDDAATLYGLLKDLTAARAALPMEEGNGVQAENLARLNTLIAIVGLYFEQGGGYSAVMEVPDPVR